MKPPRLIDGAHYTTLAPFSFVATPAGFCVRASNTPWKPIALLAAAIIGFAACFMTLPVELSGNVTAKGFMVVIGILTATGTSLAIATYYRQQRCLGPVLEFNSSEQVVTLPRHKIQVPIDQVERMCVVNGWLAEDLVSQLQLHTKDGDCFLVTTGWDQKQLEPLLRSIAVSTGVYSRILTQDRKAREKWHESPLPNA